MAPEAGLNRAAEGCLVEVGSRDVDRHHEPVPVFLPAVRLRERSVQDESGQGLCMGRVLDDGYELAGGYRT